MRTSKSTSSSGSTSSVTTAVPRVAKAVDEAHETRTPEENR